MKRIKSTLRQVPWTGLALAPLGYLFGWLATDSGSFVGRLVLLGVAMAMLMVDTYQQLSGR